MEFQTLKKSHIKRNIIIGVVAVAIISACILTFSRAKYRVTNNIKVAEGTINYKIPDLNLVSLYLQNEEGNYIEADTIPASGYTLNKSQSYCGRSNNGEIIKDGSVNIIYENGAINVNNITKKGTKCYLYFDEGGSMTVQELIVSKKIDNSRSGVITGILTTDTTGTVYSIEDDWGTSYVYAGAPTDNWVAFAGFYWRIIRINGDGSIRMIYNGTTTDQVEAANQIIVDGNNMFRYNQTYGDNTYVGYMMGLDNQCVSSTNCFGTTNTTSYMQSTSNIFDSNVKKVLDNWYQTSIVNQNLTEYISIEAGFCNDRQTMSGVETSYGTLGYGTNATGYAPAGRLYQNGSWRRNQTPTLKCSQIDNDLFTLNGSTKGNNILTYPIGLITSDEVVLAGGFGGTANTNYYLYNGQHYWTMSPYRFYASDGGNLEFIVANDGSLISNYEQTTSGIRPVINLRADITLSGSGTSTDPYTIS